MFYVVPDVQLITQDMDMSCWYASAQMIIAWRRRTEQMTEAAHPDPSQVAKWQKLKDDDPGINNDTIREFARDLGLIPVPPLTPSPNAILEWLQRYGPLWVNGKRHITVIAGIKTIGDRVEVLVFDPAPSKKDKIFGEWRDFQKWYLQDSHSGRDVSSEVETVFLYVPQN